MLGRVYTELTMTKKSTTTKKRSTKVTDTPFEPTKVALAVSTLGVLTLVAFAFATAAAAAR